MSIITPILAALLAVSFPFRGTIRDDGGAVIPGLKQQIIDFRLYSSVDQSTALWGRRCTVDVQENGLFVVEVSDGMGPEIPSGSGIEVTYASLETALGAIGSSPLYAGFTLADRSIELKPRTRITPVPSALVAIDADEAAALFTLTNALTVSKGVQVGDGLVVKSELKAFQIAGTDKLNIGGNLSVSNAIVGVDGLRVQGSMTVGGKLTTGQLTAGSLSAPTATLTTVTAQTAAFTKAPMLSNVAPKGMIVMWYGDATKIPQDWALCDGKTYGDVTTPNLSGLFIVGASKDPKGENKTYSVGDTGGEESVTLKVDNLPKHSHTFTDYQLGYNSYDNYSGEEYFTFEKKQELNAYTNGRGLGQAHANLPSYCAVYYLMKVK